MKTKKLLILFLINLGYNILFGQGENDNWYFGTQAAVNFSGSNISVLTNSNMYALEACGSVSDANGNLLFYMNGEKIWNRDHQVMPNGTLIAPYQNDTAQQLAIVKNPTNSNQYFVFTTGENSSSSSYKINYSIVDMTLGTLSNGSPLGDIVSNMKNIPVVDNLGNSFGSEAVTIVPNPVNNSFWVLIPHGNNLYSYQLDTNGFHNGNPLISNLNFPVTLGNQKYYSIKASAKLNNSFNYNNLICISYWSGDNTPDDAYVNQVYSYDAANGQITNQYSLRINSLRAYLPEFNKNTSVLFLGYQNIHAVDLINSTSSNVISTQIYTDQPSIYNGLGIQRNKNGEIFVSKKWSGYLGKIINPDNYSTTLSVNMNFLSLNGRQASYGLPQLIPLNEPETYYPCIENLTLISEPNLNFTYEIGKKITTKDSYILGSRHNITMQAGETVSLLPGTTIQNGAYYHAFIAPCGEKEESFSKMKQNLNQKDMVLNLDIEERKALNNMMIDVYPNPASTYVNINSGNEKITSWELYDMSGKNILKGNSTQINVQSLPKATYLLNININNKIVTKKVIVK